MSWILISDVNEIIFRGETNSADVIEPLQYESNSKNEKMQRGIIRENLNDQHDGMVTQT
jgi:hypothetical protein